MGGRAKLTKTTMRILYLSRSKMNHSVNAVYIKGLRLNGADVKEVFVRHDEFFELIKYLVSNRKTFDSVFVGYDSPQLVILSKLFSRKKVTYNALCSVYERLIVSRAFAPPYSVKALYYWFLDFLSFNLADLTMVETDSQADYCAKFFLAPRKKFFRAWTGVDEEKFYFNPDIDKFSRFTVIFRGQFLPESGVEYAIKAAKILENEYINFIIHGGGFNADKIKKLVEDLKPKNLRMITDFLPAEELRTLMQKCHLSLGQLSDHPRLERTVPHKAFESLAMKLPYLTVSNKGVLELLKTGEVCVSCELASAESLAKKILWSKGHPQELERTAENGYLLYKDKLNSLVLAKKLLAHINLL